MTSQAKMYTNGFALNGLIPAANVQAVNSFSNCFNGFSYTSNGVQKLPIGCNFFLKVWEDFSNALYQHFQWVADQLISWFNGSLWFPMLLMISLIATLCSLGTINLHVKLVVKSMFHYDFNCYHMQIQHNITQIWMYVDEISWVCKAK